MRDRIQPSSGIQPDSYSDTRSVLISRPATLGVLLRAARALRVFVAEKCTPSVLGARHSHVAPRRGDPNTLRANPIPEDIPMNTISLTGTIVSIPVTDSVGSNLHYTSFRLWLHDRYLDSKGNEYFYDEEYSILCVGKLDQFIRTIPRGEEIEVKGQLRGRHHVLRVDGPVPIDISYPRVIADSIT